VCLSGSISSLCSADHRSRPDSLGEVDGARPGDILEHFAHAMSLSPTWNFSCHGGSDAEVVERSRKRRFYRNFTLLSAT